MREITKQEKNTVLLKKLPVSLEIGSQHGQVRDAVTLVTLRYGESSRVLPLKNGLYNRHIIPFSATTSIRR